MNETPPQSKTREGLNFEPLSTDPLRKGFLAVRDHQGSSIRSLGIILRLVETASAQRPLNEMCHEMVRILLEETDFESGSILLYQPEKDRLVLAAVGGFLETLEGKRRDDPIPHVAVRRGRDVQWTVYDTQTPLFGGGWSREPVSAAEGVDAGLGCSICLPLLRQGILNLRSSKPLKVSLYLQRDLTILANVLGHLLEATELRERLNAGHQQIQSLIEADTGVVPDANGELRSVIKHRESMIEHVPQGVCILDHEGSVQHVNPNFLFMIQSTPEEVVGQNFSQFFTKESDLTRLMYSLAAQEPVHMVDVGLVRPNGSKLSVDIFSHSLGNLTGQSHTGMLVIHDFMREKEFAEQLVHNEKLTAVGSMASGIAHNFNNLLTTVLGNAELLSRETCDPKFLRRLKNIEEAALAGASTVDRLEIFAGLKAQTGNGQHSASVKEAILEVVDLTKPRWKDDKEREGATITVHLDLQDTPPASVSPSALREVLAHLIFNAVDVMQLGGDLTLRCVQHGDLVVIEVTDTGTGMSSEVQRRIFDPFFTTKGGSHSGLGLSVCYGIVTQTGGRIEIDSEEGGGTTFRLRLPVGHEQSYDPVVVPSVEQVRPLHILAVDDEPEIIELLSTMLGNFGHQVTGISDGTKAIELLSTEAFDVVLTDLSMPRVSGWDIAAVARRKVPKVPVILLTGWGAQYEEMDLQDAGIDGVIAKPFRLEELMSALGNLIPSDGSSQ